MVFVDLSLLRFIDLPLSQIHPALIPDRS